MVTTRHIEPEPDTARGRWIAAWLLLWTASVVIIGIWVIDRSQQQTAQRVQSQTTEQAERIRDRIEADLEILRALPMVLAAQVNARQLLLERLRNPAEIAQNTGLNAHYARIAAMIGVDTIFLADSAGEIVAGHSFTTSNPQGVVGENTSDREYFAEAKAGQLGEQFAIAKLSRLPSVFFSAPVIENDVFIGAVVVKATTKRMRALLDVGGGARVLLIDAQDVVIAATDDNDYLRRAAATQPLNDAVDLRYGSATPDTNPIVFVEGRSYGNVRTRMTTAGNGPYIKSTTQLNDERWTVCLMLGTEPIGKVTRQWRLALLLAWLVGALLVLLVIRSVRHVHDLDRLANIDVLSGLGNRRHYDSIVGSLCDAHDRGRIQHVALALFDLDNFKLVNDQHGHSTGDRVIKQFAEHLAKSTRRMDYLFRLGGDEFAALILELTPSAAEQAVQGIQARLRMATDDDPKLPAPSVSIGLAYHQRGESPDAFYRRADKAMYKAKDGGRNQFHVAASDAAPEATPKTP